MPSLSDDDLSALKSEVAFFGVDVFAHVLEREASVRRAKVDSDQVAALKVQMREFAAIKAREVADTLRVQAQAHALETKTLQSQLDDARAELAVRGRALSTSPL